MNLAGAGRLGMSIQISKALNQDQHLSAVCYEVLILGELAAVF